MIIYLTTRVNGLRVLNVGVRDMNKEKCNECKYREINGKPHEMCKCCVCGNRFVKDKNISDVETKAQI